MKHKKHFALCLFTAILLLCSCKGSQSYSSLQFYAMNTIIDVTVSQKDFDFSELENYVYQTEKLLSKTNPESDIFRLNEDGVCELSDITAELIRLSKLISNETGGAFDICSGALSELWDITSENPKIPSDADIRKAVNLCGNDKLVLNGNTAVITETGAKADLGAVAKGYCAEKCIEMLKAQGIENAMVSFGGNVAVTGSSQSNLSKGKTGWNIGIKNPDDTSDIIGYINLSDKVTAVSGDYERYFEKDGKRYCHIFDISTGFPASSGLRSAAVICENGAIADALSTALFVMGAEKSLELYNSGLYSFEAVLISDNAEIFLTDGITDSFVKNPTAKNSYGQKYIYKALSQLNI